MKQPILLSVQQVSKCYQSHQAVSGASFEVTPGECVALVGHNGAGKTTMMKMILGLAKPSSGNISLFGFDVSENRPDTVAQRIGFLPEVISFPPQMTGLEALRYFAKLKNADTALCEAELGTVGLADAARKRIRTYSKGMRQRLGLAQALLGQPELLILDEPTTGLDPDLRRQFYEILDQRRAQGTAVLLSSHALSELERHVDRVVVIEKGHVVANGTMTELRQAACLPVHIRVRAENAQSHLMSDTPTGVDARRINGRTVELTCAADHKVEVLRWITASGHSIDDLVVDAPDLDRIYQYYRHAHANLDADKPEGDT